MTVLSRFRAFLDWLDLADYERAKQGLAPDGMTDDAFLDLMRDAAEDMAAEPTEKFKQIVRDYGRFLKED